MKHKILLCALAMSMCAPLFSTAQHSVQAFGNPSNTDGRTDTVIDAGGMTLKGYTNVSGPLAIHFLATKVSGTVSATAYLETGLDPAASSYVLIDSVVLSNQTTNQALRTYASNAYTKYQWRIVSTGTQKFIVRSWYK